MTINKEGFVNQLKQRLQSAGQKVLEDVEKAGDLVVLADSTLYIIVLKYSEVSQEVTYRKCDFWIREIRKLEDTLRQYARTHAITYAKPIRSIIVTNEKVREQIKDALERAFITAISSYGESEEEILERVMGQIGEPLYALRVSPVPPLEGFIGREEEIKGFQQMIQSQVEERVMAIYGAPGIGKSWLVNKLVQECDTADIHWAKVDFRESTYDRMGILIDIQGQLGERYSTSFNGRLDEYLRYREQQQREYPSMEDAMRGILIEKKQNEVTNEFIACLGRLSEHTPAVLLFDSFERVEDTELASWMRKKLLIGVRDSRLPNVLVVIAGRNESYWGKDWERVLSSHELRCFSENEVEAYLVQEIGIEPVDAELVAAVHQYASGHPLGVALVTDLIGEGIRRQERVSKEMLTAYKEEFDRKMVSELLVKHILEWLDEDVAQAVRYCAIPRWFDSEMIRTLGKMEDGSQVMLDRLVKHRSFVRPHFPGGYEYHETVRELLLEKWQSDDPEMYRELNRRALADWERRLERAVEREKNALILECLYHQFILGEDIGIGQFTGLFDSAAKFNENDFCLALLNELKSYPLHWEDSRTWVRYCEARLVANRGQWHDAEEAYRELLDQVRLGLELKSHVTNELGRLYHNQGRFDQATRMFSRSLEAQEMLGDKSRTALTLIYLGETYRELGMLSDATNYFSQSLKLADEAQNRYDVGLGKVNLGFIYAFQGKWDEAIQNLDEALSIFQKLGYRYGIGRALQHLGWVYQVQGLWEKAVDSHQESVEISRDMNLPYLLARGLSLLGELSRLQCKWENAEKCLMESENICQRLETEFAMGTVQDYWGSLRRDQGRYSEALKHYTTSLEILEKIDNPYEIGCTLIHMGDLYSGQRDSWDNALNCYIRSLDIARKVGGLYWQVRALVGLSNLSYLMGAFNEIAKYAEEAETLAKEYEYYEQLAMLQCVQASLLFDQGRYRKAFSKYAEACTSALRYNRYVLDKTAEMAIGRMYKSVEDGYQEEAIEFCNYLIDYWQREGFEKEEEQNRRMEVGDGRPQMMFVQRLYQSNAKMLERD